MSETISLVVPGKCEPRGSKISVPIYDDIIINGKPLMNPRNGKPYQTPRMTPQGRPMSYMRDDNPKSGPWMEKIRRAAREVMGDRPPFGCAVKLNIRFYLERPLYHFGTGRNLGVLKEKFVTVQHIVRPDRLKLARAVEDALTGIFYVDDAQTVGGPPEKFYVTPGERPRVEIDMLLPNVRAAVVQKELIER